MPRLRQRIAQWGQLWVLGISEVARFEGIILADFHNGRNTSHFRDTLLAALRLVKDVDPRRFARVRHHLKWIVSTKLAFRHAAEYQHSLQICAIDFQQPSAEYDKEYLIGWYACTLIHEATHGVIRSKGISYTPALRSRIERLCVREEQRFVRRLSLLQPQLAQRLYRDYDATIWERSWNATRAQHLRAQLGRIWFTDDP